MKTGCVNWEAKSGKLLKQFKEAYSFSLTHGLIRGLLKTTNEVITVSLVRRSFGGTVYKLIHTMGNGSKFLSIK